jgi:hypothetical protein
MRPETIFLGITLMGIMGSGILFVYFGQKTMRKLRKNPKTKHLGIEFVSGYDTVNVMEFHLQI